MSLELLSHWKHNRNSEISEAHLETSDELFENNQLKKKKNTQNFSNIYFQLHKMFCPMIDIFIKLN